MRFMMMACGDKPLTVILEPSGMEYVLEPGDHFVFEWVEEIASERGEAIVHTPTSVTVEQVSADDRMWDSRGNEMSWIG